MTTEKQKRAVSFCEEMLGVEFTGNINSFEEVSKYLSLHLNSAKEMDEEMSLSNQWAIVNGYI